MHLSTPAIFVLAAALLGISCSTPPTLGVGDGRTLFLGDMPLPPIPANPLGGSGQRDDSWWRGDGVTGTPAIKLDLSDQRAYFYKGGVLVGESPISSGDESHRTPTGTFKVTQKSPNHRSNLYGDYVDAYGNVVVAGVDSRKDKRPPGTKYRGASMPYFLRFNGGIGTHGGYLPGYPASHGCVRLPVHMAEKFYRNSPHGTRVSVVY